MRSFALLFAVLAVCCVTIQAQSKESVAKIDAYLMEQTESDEVEANFAAAKKYLAELKQKTHIFGSERVNFLKNFLRIESVLNECTVRSFEIIDEVKKDLWFQRGRVWNVIVNAREKLANNCVAVVQEEIHARSESMREEDQKLVQQFTDIAIKYIKVSRPQESYRELLREGVRSTRNVNYNKQVLELLQEENKKHPENGGYSSKQMCLRYVIEPCGIYTRRLEPVLELLTNVLEHSSNPSAELETEHYRYHVCEYIAGRGQFDLIKDIENILS